AAARGPLLRAHHRGAGRRPVRLAAPRHGGRLGGGGGHAMSPYLRSRRKRALDLLACLVLGILAAPVVGVAILLVRLESPGHPIYRQRRVGRHGEPFELYKLRTMVSGAERMGL